MRSAPEPVIQVAAEPSSSQTIRARSSDYYAGAELIEEIRDRKLTYLSVAKLRSLVETCASIERRGVPGLFIEAGCALGGSSIVIAATKLQRRPLWVYDVFDMIPPPTNEDTEDVHARYRTIATGQAKGIRGDQYYGYQANLYDSVRANLESFGIDCDRDHVRLIKGLVQEVMTVDQPVAFAHIDVDWYEPVKTCLGRLFPNLTVGGCMILDDYYNWGGCKKAVDEYLQTVVGEYELENASRSLRIARVAPSAKR